MKLPPLAALGLSPDILSETVPGEDRLVLWFPAGKAEGCRLWERISSVPGEVRSPAPGIFTVPAVLVPVREQVRGRFGQLWQRLWDTDSERTWSTPTGEVAEQYGDKQTGLLLVWAEPSNAALTESTLEALWPNAKRRHQVGEHVALIGGMMTAASPPVMVESERSRPAAGTTEDAPEAMALAALDAARRSGDRRQEATALIDVGLVHLDAGRAVEARQSFQQALDLAIGLKDSQVEGDACSGLGTVALLTGNAPEGLALFERELSAARQAGNRVAEKVALSHLGICHSALGSPESAVAAFEQALALARELGDRVHEAELLWHLAVLDAELGHTAKALPRGPAAIDGYAAMEMQEARYLAGYLERFRATQASLPAPALGFGGSFVAGISVPVDQPSPPPNPGILRMALSGLSAVARFTASGFQTSPEETRRHRLDACHSCEHHTGLRCRLCGCFTSVKARFPAERCPLAKWTE